MDNRIIYCSDDLGLVLKERRFEVFAHDCSCFGKPASGLAKLLNLHLPELAAADRDTTKGDPAKLGSISVAELGERKYAVNAYIWFDTFRMTEAGTGYAYEAVRSCFRKLNRLMAAHGVNSLALPKIGASFPQSDWTLLEKIIATELEGREIRIYRVSQVGQSNLVACPQ